MIVIPVTDTRIKPLLCAKPFILCNLLESSEESKKAGFVTDPLLLYLFFSFSKYVLSPCFCFIQTGAQKVSRVLPSL